MIRSGDIVAYLEMCSHEGTTLQRGMNFRIKPTYSIVLMSVRPGAPYHDRIENDGKTLIYEGHDVPKQASGADPKTISQPMHHPGGSLTQNGLFYQAAHDFLEGRRSPEPVKVYEKLREGIWVFNGLFELVDAWQEQSGSRTVFKFKLNLLPESTEQEPIDTDLEHNRFIPTAVKLEVWKRDKGQCVQCGNSTNLHYDHIIPFSKGGSSLTAANIQLLCAKHNLSKHNRIE